MSVFINNILLQQFSWPPTVQQKEVFALLSEFIHTFSVDSCFILKGYAGTGKTTIISALVKSLPAVRKKTVLLAPTGRAAKVMGLNVAGVDLIRSKHGPLVLEVNSSPGLEGIERATEKDIASLIIEFIEKNAAPGKTQTKGRG